MSRSENRYRKMTLDEIKEMYTAWLASEDETNEEFAARYGFDYWNQVRYRFEENGFPTAGAKPKTCPMCGERFYSSTKTRKYCSAQCQREASITSQRDFKELQRAEREKRIKERFPGYAAITAISVAAQEAGMNYGAYVAKMGL